MYALHFNVGAAKRLRGGVGNAMLSKASHMRPATD